MRNAVSDTRGYLALQLKLSTGNPCREHRSAPIFALYLIFHLPFILSRSPLSFPLFVSAWSLHLWNVPPLPLHPFMPTCTALCTAFTVSSSFVSPTHSRYIILPSRSLALLHSASASSPYAFSSSPRCLTQHCTASGHFYLLLPVCLLLGLGLVMSTHRGYAPCP
jgi:hypothetical protein